MEIAANNNPTTPTGLIFSPKMKMPIEIVTIKLSTAHVVPTTANSSLPRRATSQAKASRQ